MRRRSRLWWYLRFRRAYKKHGIPKFYSRREVWEHALIGRRKMDPAEQRKLKKIK